MSLHDKLGNLSSEKKALLAKLLLEKKLNERQEATKPIPALSQGKDILPLSFSQERIWVNDKLYPGSIMYNIAGVSKIEGNLEPELLSDGFNFVASRHSILRAVFKEIDGSSAIVINENMSLRPEIIDFLGLERNEADRRLKEYIDRDVRKPFDLEAGPLLRVAIIRVDSREWYAVVTMHHIISDGLSTTIFFKETISYYDAISKGRRIPLPELSIQYTDFTLWQRNRYQGDSGELLQYWKSKLDSSDFTLELVSNAVSAKTQITNSGSRQPIYIDEELTAKIRELSQKEGVTVFNVLLAALYSLIYRCSGQEDIIVGTIVSGRDRLETRDLIGCFINTLVLRVQTNGNSTFKDFLKYVQQTAIDGFQHQEMPFERLVQEYYKDRSLQQTPLCQIIFSYEDHPANNLNVEGFNISFEEIDNGSSKVELELELIKTSDGITGWLNYSTDLFEGEYIKKLTEYYIALLKDIVSDPFLSISDIKMLPDSEQNMLLKSFNDTAAEFPNDKTIYQLFEEQVVKTPDNVAAIFEGRKLSYRELNEKANRLAATLRKKGVKPDSIVALALHRSLEMIVGIMGVLKAGGAYLPISPEYPTERIAYIMEDSEAAILLTQQKFAESLAGLSGFETLILEDESIYSGDGENLDAVTKPNNLAYVIYTSGSTGKPKGAMLEHRSLINRINWMQKTYPIGTGDIILQKTPYTFDVSVWELLWWSVAGAGVCFLEPGGEKDPSRILKAVKDEKVSVMHFVPSMLSIFLEYIDGMEDIESLKSLKNIFASGEALTPQQANRFNKLLNKRFGTKLHNLYGPTEAAIDVSYFNCSTGVELEIVPIGKPIDNIKLYILGKNNELQPLGVPGELHISGTGLARGYLKRPELTAEKFIESPFEKGERLYKTGDLARLLPDGNIEYLGRLDYQVKIRGFRIELGEIENLLSKYGPVKEAVVMARKDAEGDKYLCAYITAEREIVVEEIREYLLKELPDYMVPAYFVQLDKMPLSPNGKIDRKALPEPDGNIKTGVEFVAPVTEKEKILADVWSKVLKVENIGIDDNFFSLGGDSIKSIQVLSRLKGHGFSLEMKELFMYPTIGKLAGYLKGLKKESYQGVVEGDVELLPMQKWLFEKAKGFEHHFNNAVLLYAKQGLDGKVISNVLEKITDHHDALRMVYTKEQGRVIQLNRGIGDKACETEEIQVDAGDDYRQIIEQEGNRIQKSFNVSKGPLVKACLFKTVDGDFLLICIHHLVVDVISWRIIEEDFSNGYLQGLRNEKIEFALKTDSFKEWSEKINVYSQSMDILEELEYWRTVEETQIKPLPKDMDMEKRLYGNMEKLCVNLDEQNTRLLLTEVNQAYNTEINDILLTALAMTISKWTNHEQVVINLEGHGREGIIKDVDVGRTVGWFTSQFPIALEVSREMDISAAIKSVKEKIRQIPNKGMVYGILKYMTLWDEMNGSEFTLEPQICFNYLGQLEKSLDTALFEISDLNSGSLQSPDMECPFALDILGVVRDGILRMDFIYNKNEYFGTTVESLANSFVNNLTAIIRHCEAKSYTEFTPSDLSTISLGVEDIDAVYEALEISGSSKKVKDIYTLSPTQEGMLYYSQSNKESYAYFEQMNLYLSGRLDMECLEKSFDILVQTHDVFRTKFITRKVSRPLQVVMREGKASIDFLDLSHMTDAESMEYINNFKKNDKDRGFDLAKDMLIRVTVFKTSDEKYSFVWSYHHIIMDGWCLGVLSRELFETYGALKEGKDVMPSNVPSYSSYIKWLERQNRHYAEEYWSKYISGYEKTASIPKASSAVSKDSRYSLEEYFYSLDDKTWDSLQDIAKNNNLTMNILIQALWGILLQKYNNTSDAVFGGVVSGRPYEIEGIETMIGLFINTVPVRVKCSEDSTFLSLARKMQEDLLNSDLYNYYPLVEIQSKSGLGNSLLDHILVYENYPFDDLIGSVMHGIRIDKIDVFEQSGFDLHAMVIPGRELKFKIAYNSNVYQKSDVELHMNRYSHTAECIISNPDILISDINIISDENKKKVLSSFNDDLENEL